MAKQFGIFCGLIIACLLVCNTARAAEHYVDLNSTNPTPPYSTWATAATNIQDAVDVALDGDTVWVTNGIYALTAEITITNDITIQSVHGPKVTVVDGGGSNRCFNIEDRSCQLIGLTIQNGYVGGEKDEGGGVYCGGVNTVVTNCTLSENYAAYGGGMSGGRAMECQFLNNSAIRGGGLYLGDAEHCLFEENEATWYGGGMAGKESWRMMREGTANHCTFINNTSYGYESYGFGYDSGGGGGIAYVAATNSVFINNSANRGIGGGAFGSHAQNCLFTGNSALYGGAIGAYYAPQSSAPSRAEHCTLTQNRAKQWGGGLFETRAFNCIIWYNDADISGDNIYPHGTDPWWYASGRNMHSCSPDLAHGVDGNITNAPMLVSSSHISPDSPCVGAGTNLAYQSDIDGEPWMHPPSIGCDEPTSTAAGPIILYIADLPERCVVEHPTDVHLSIMGACSEFTYDLGDGTIHSNTVVSDHLVFQHQWNQAGVYPIVLTAFNADHPGGLSDTQHIEVVSADEVAIYVAPTGSDSHSGESWASAKASIKAGVDAQVVPGGSVWITNGTYHLTEHISVERPIVVQSVHGPASTIVDGGGSNICFYLNDFACTLRGLTIRNGMADGSAVSNSKDGVGGFTAGGGVFCYDLTPLVESCVIQSNSASDGGGMYNGTANHCIFVDNVSHRDGGGMLYGMANHCRFERNAVASFDGFGGGMAIGVASNCVFTENSGSFGGGAYEITAFNCTFIGNTASEGGGIASHSGYFRYSPPAALNCTIVGNRADIESGGLHNTPATNCIVWHNTATISWDNLNTPEEAAFSCSPDITHGVSGNITNAPIFVDPAAGDYRLQSNSPCINWGNNAFAPGATDLDGNPRIVGPHVDMGAYEFQADLGPDSDGNGLPDDWERAYFGYRVLPSENPDGDSASNGNEYIAGTDPTDSTSLFVVTNASLSAEGYVVQWEPVAGRSYSVWWSDALTNEFQLLATGLPYPVNSYTDTVHTVEGASFYQLVVELAD